LITSGARRMLRGPVRCGPTTPLLSMPMATDWVSPKPRVGEWQPAQVLSLFSPVIGVETRAAGRRWPAAG